MSEEGTTDNENVTENEVVADSTTTTTTTTPASPNVDVKSTESAFETQDNSNESENQQNNDDDDDGVPPEEESGEQELVQEKQQPQPSDDAFDSIKDATATTTEDTTDNGACTDQIPATIDEPMEVDEQNSQEADTSIANKDENTQESAEDDDDDGQVGTEENEANANESNELDGSNHHTNEETETATATHENETETSQMEVDCETPQGEDVPDRGGVQPLSDDLNAGDGDGLKSGDDESSMPATTATSTALDDSKASAADDSVMEHNVEQFNCSNMSDTSQKDQTISNDDPFDSLMRNDGNSMSEPSSEQQQQQKNYDDENDRSNAASSIGEPIEDDANEDGADAGSDRDECDDNNMDNDVDNDNADADDNADDDDDAGDTNSHHDGSTIEAVDDIEEGKGADEELCLLPDEEEREISDADRERAMQNQQQAADEIDEIDENEQEESDANDAVGMETIEENGEKDATDDNEAIQDAGEQMQSEPGSGAAGTEATDTVAAAEAAATAASIVPSIGEIKEIDSADAMDEKVCVECGQMIKCKYSLLKEITPQPSNEEDAAGAAADATDTPQTEIQYLCDTACVTKFNNAHTQYKVVVKKVPIFYAMDTEQACQSCSETKLCKYRFKEPSTDAEQPQPFSYVCDEECLNRFCDAHPDRYVLAKKRFIIEEASAADAETETKCMQCLDDAKCKYTFKEDEHPYYLCTEPCLNLLMAEQPDRFRFKRQSIRVKDLTRRPTTTVHDTLLAGARNDSTTAATSTTTPSKRSASGAGAQEKSKKMVARTEDQQRMAQLDREASFSRRCAQCYSDIMLLETNLQWETMDFCNESCLGQYQQAVGAACQSCQNAVSVASMGKYCVRFGFELRQFCRSACLDAFKKGLKVCSYCQLDIKKNDEFLAPINGQFKDFCSKTCMKHYEQIFNHKKHIVKQCAVCNNQKNVRVEIIIDAGTHYFCSNPCFSAFSFVNNVNPDSCAMCRKYFERRSTNAHTIYQGNETKVFCSKICMNIYIIAKREIAPCQWCKVRKYNFDMIQKASPTGGSMMLCSINCLSMCEVSMNAIAMKQQKCDQCNSMTTPQYHLTMSDASMRNFCTYQCVMSFQSQFSRAPLTLDGEVAAAAAAAGGAPNHRSHPVPTGLPKRIKSTQLLQQQQHRQQQQQQQLQAKSQAKTKSTPATRGSKTSTYQAAKQPSSTSNNLVISSVTSLASSTRSTRRSNQSQNSSLNNEFSRLQPVVELEPLPDNVVMEKTSRPVGRPRSTPATAEPSSKSLAASSSTVSSSTAAPQVRIEKQTQIVTIPPLPKRIANAATMCAPSTHNKEIQARPMQFTVGCQTDSYLERKMVIPIPVPIYAPTPLPMYAQPFPVPVPIPLPIPVPVFIPTTRNSANGIMKEIKKIQDKMPADPFEAELLMMAEMVAGDKKKEEETDSSDDENVYQPQQQQQQQQQQQHHHHSHEEMGTNNFGEDIMQMALKMATEYDPTAVDLEASMQANTITPHSHPGMGGGDVMQNHHMMMMAEEHQRPQRKRGPTPRGQQHQQQQQQQQQRQAAKRQRRGGVMQDQPPQPEPPREPVEKADANMCLKFTFGVNAWKQWVMTKNSELEKSSVRRKLFKTELLQLTADELNYSLCLFVKEVRKPNGSEYAPDTIYYLVLGIQEYLYENGRIDNIFTDPYYERFTDCLDEVAKKFSVLYNDSQYIVTRVEEEHLWECKQLGAHSPHVLLSTLMFFNTKHFNLTTVEEHMQLSFSHIMKHWKRNPNQGSGKMAGSRNVLLRFYPPQSSHIDNSRKKKVYEQQENEENPLRCPVKLYEFYLSKCPESVKTRNDVFYLLPERSCVPDSPVWYSTQALGKEALSKMLHRVKMVKEINIALLTS